MDQKYFSPALTASFPALFLKLACAALLLPQALVAGPSAIFTTLYSFDYTNSGGNSVASLIQGSDGNFYGTTENDAAHFKGAVFKMTPDGTTVTVLTSFPGATDGANPGGSLMEASNGLYYGMTQNGGGGLGLGTVFSVSANGDFNTIHRFEGDDGVEPNGNLIIGRDGYFYGTTFFGGPAGFGNVFKMSASGAATNLYLFSGGNDGANPGAGLTVGSDGNFYGTTLHGGTNQQGVIFRITTNGVFANLYSFAGPEGSNPYGLTPGRDGNLYGIAALGGISNNGVVFKYGTNGVLTDLHLFTGGDGSEPFGTLVEGSDGDFYGTTSGGADEQAGSIFTVSPDGVFTSLYSFTGSDDGGYPEAGLAQGTNGSFYGLGESGGVNNVGTVFRLTILPEFLDEKLVGRTLNLTWSAEVGGTYQLQSVSNVSATNWTDIGNLIVASQPTVTATDSVTNAQQRFYQIVIPR